MKVFEVSIHEGANKYIDVDIENILSVIAGEMKKNDVGTKISIITKEMDDKDLYLLPKFDEP